MMVSSAAAYAQDAAIEATAAPTQEVTPAQNNVVRYSAGDSIPLGYFVQATELPAAAQVRRYSAGESIALGEPLQAKELSVPAQVRRYSAGDSIALGYPQPAQAGSAAAAPAAPQAKVAGFSKASRLPLAGALADSVSTHIGLNQPGLAEKNALVNTSAAGLLGLFVLKAGVVYYFEQQQPPLRRSGLKATAGVWNGVAMNNILLIAGASNPVSLLGGALFGAFMYQREGRVLEKEASPRVP